ncbi:MAG TPA: tetratricopeptide repeat protein, partial [Dongiaceae bacterium]
MKKPARTVGARRDQAQRAAAATAKATLQMFKRAMEAQQRGRLAEAENLYKTALKHEPRHVPALLNLATLLRILGRVAESHAVSERAVAAAPEDALTQFALGVSFRRQRRDKEAMAAYEKALAIDPGLIKAWTNLAVSADRLDRARSNEALDKVLAMDPDSPVALNVRLKYMLQECDFEAGEAIMRRLIKVIGGNLEKLHDWRLLANTVYRTLMVPTPAPLERRITDRIDELHRRTLSESGAPPPLPRPDPAAAKRRLRIGYMTPNLTDHPVGHVTLQLFPAHDRSRFEVHAFATEGRRGGDSSYARLHRKGVDFYHDVGQLPPIEIARRIRNLGIDILVDLDGYMETMGTTVLVYRPAPIQIYWLGHAGGLGLSFVDYLIADAIVVPPDEEGAYRESILRLPECYHVASRAIIAEATPGRTECGLPEQGFVFGAFNNPEKIDRTVFVAWMKILAAVPGSVLWLSSVRGVPAQIESLRRRAESHGIDPARLVFAERLADKAAHFARHRHIGLFLDTLTLNASTTALDALWAGVPLLAVRGRRFASRISNTMLTHIGMADMIVADVDSYLARAVHLADHPDELAALRRRLAANREQMPLFDVQRFARHLESAYEAVWARYCRGEAPVTLNTPALPGRLPARPTPVSVAPATPQKDRSGLVQLHVEGSEAKEGWTTIGARPGPGVDRVSDPRHLAEFAQDSVDAIYASWFYQRLSHREELPAALASAWRVLKPGGTLRLAVP